MEIIDILAPTYAELPYFTVDTRAGVNSVAVNAYAGAELSFLLNAKSQSRFQPHDNLILMSAGIVLPEMFTFASYTNGAATSLSVFSPLIYDDTDTLKANFPGAESIAIPMENYEVALGVFANFHDLNVQIGVNSSYYRIGLKDTDVNRVSMINVPTALNDLVIKVIPFIKVLHTLPMFTPPPPP